MRFPDHSLCTQTENRGEAPKEIMGILHFPFPQTSCPFVISGIFAFDCVWDFFQRKQRHPENRRIEWASEALRTSWAWRLTEFTFLNSSWLMENVKKIYGLSICSFSYNIAMASFPERFLMIWRRYWTGCTLILKENVPSLTVKMATYTCLNFPPKQPYPHWPQILKGDLNGLQQRLLGSSLWSPVILRGGGKSKIPVALRRIVHKERCLTTRWTKKMPHPKKQGEA